MPALSCSAMTCVYKTLLQAFKPVLASDFSTIEKKMLDKTLEVLTELDFAQKSGVQDALYTLSQLLYQQYGKNQKSSRYYQPQCPALKS